jgi:hypothetical protein
VNLLRPLSSTLSSTVTLGRGLLAGLCLLTVVAALVGDVWDGTLGRFGPNVATADLGRWALYASANSMAAVVAVVAISTPLGAALGLLTSRGSTASLLHWLELTSTLPAFVLTALWVTGSPHAPLTVLGLSVAVQRALQLAVLVNRAERSRLEIPLLGSLYPVAEGTEQLRRWAPLLWVGAAHSAVLLATEHAALVLLGFVPATPNTWLSTVATAMQGAADVSPVALVIAGLGLLLVPWALAIQGRPTTTTKNVLQVVG